jgi:hypothetical protein
LIVFSFHILNNDFLHPSSCHFFSKYHSQFALFCPHSFLDYMWPLWLDSEVVKEFFCHFLWL